MCFLIHGGVGVYLVIFGEVGVGVYNFQAPGVEAYIRNRYINNRLNLIPYEAFAGKRPNVSNMNIFGSSCYAYKHDETKLDDRCEKGLFIGYDDEPTRWPSGTATGRGAGRSGFKSWVEVMFAKNHSS